MQKEVEVIHSVIEKAAEAGEFQIHVNWFNKNNGNTNKEKVQAILTEEGFGITHEKDFGTYFVDWKEEK